VWLPRTPAPAVRSKRSVRAHTRLAWVNGQELVDVVTIRIRPRAMHAGEFRVVANVCSQAWSTMTGNVATMGDSMMRHVREGAR